MAAAVGTEVGLRGGGGKRGGGGTPLPVAALVFVGVCLVGLLAGLLAVEFLLLVERVHGLGGASCPLKRALRRSGLEGTRSVLIGRSRGGML